MRRRGRRRRIFDRRALGRSQRSAHEEDRGDDDDERAEDHLTGLALGGRLGRGAAERLVVATGAPGLGADRRAVERAARGAGGDRRGRRGLGAGARGILGDRFGQRLAELAAAREAILGLARQASREDSVDRRREAERRRERLRRLVGDLGGDGDGVVPGKARSPESAS